MTVVESMETDVLYGLKELGFILFSTQWGFKVANYHLSFPPLPTLAPSEVGGVESSEATGIVPSSLNRPQVEKLKIKPGSPFLITTPH